MQNALTPVRVFTALACMGVLAVLLISGCKKDDIVNPPDPGGGGGGGTGTVADSARLAALAAFNAFSDSLDYSTPAVYTTILQYFRSHPETYEASDSSDAWTVWARFKDGRLFIVSDGTDTTSGSPGAIRGGSHRPNSLRASLDNLPTNARARLINALGPAFEPFGGSGAEGTVNTLRDWFTAAGYVQPVGDASVQGLKQVQGDGVFYFSSHGSWGRTRDTLNNAYGIWTTDEVNASNEARFNADLSSTPARLCWYKALHNNNFFGSNREVHYAITAEFVRQYMTFGQNSLVFFNACQSSATVNAAFKAACIAKNAGVYLGWTNNIDGQESFKAARFFFDRLLGAHMEPPAENPPQRPFEITYVLEDMLLRQFDVHVANLGATNLVATPFFGYGGEPTLLAPTIQWAIPPFIPGDVNILIDGSYGDNPGSGGVVMLGSNALSGATWTPNRIECPAPESGGNLVVRVRGIRSNTIQLTEWRPQFTLIYRGRGSLQHRITLNINFWADVHNWRELPHKPARYWLPRYLRTMSNSSCTFESSGEYKDPNDTSIVLESWSSAIVPPFAREFTGPTFFGLSGLIDSAGRDTRFVLAFAGEYTRYVGGSGTSQQIFSPPSALLDILVQMTNGYVFPGGSIPWSSGENSATMTWGNMQPTYPPNPAGGW